jgi:adenylyl- and sulfurtransferase ThiI
LRGTNCPFSAADRWKRSKSNWLKAIATYELSIQPYQDPCSMHGRHPATWARLEEVNAIEAQIDMPALVEETLAGYVETLPLTW